MSKLKITFTNKHAEAERLCTVGFEPIECAFGQYGSVMGPLNMDHHGTESHRDGVAIRACRDHYGARAEDPRFVVTGAPDADAVLAIIALAGLVPKQNLTPTFYQLVNRFDIDPIGIDLFEEEKGIELAWFNQLQGLKQSEGGFRLAIEAMTGLLLKGLDSSERSKLERADESRRRTALEGVRSLLDKKGYPLSLPQPPLGPIRRHELVAQSPSLIVVTHSPVWGFDVWYRMAPVVVSYADRLKKITIGVADTETAKVLFGPAGLNGLWPHLGQGWGGRESVGGSPRGVPYSFADIEAVTDAIVRYFRRVNPPPSSR